MWVEVSLHYAEEYGGSVHTCQPRMTCYHEKRGINSTNGQTHEVFIQQNTQHVQWSVMTSHASKTDKRFHQTATSQKMGGTKALHQNSVRRVNASLTKLTVDIKTLEIQSTSPKLV